MNQLPVYFIREGKLVTVAEDFVNVSDRGGMSPEDLASVGRRLALEHDGTFVE